MPEHFACCTSASPSSRRSTCRFGFYNPRSVAGADWSCLRGSNSTSFLPSVKGLVPQLLTFVFGLLGSFPTVASLLAAVVRHSPVSCSGSYYIPSLHNVKGSVKTRSTCFYLSEITFFNRAAQSLQPERWSFNINI
jgi:hypothetical protein